MLVQLFAILRHRALGKSRLLPTSNCESRRVVDKTLPASDSRRLTVDRPMKKEMRLETRLPRLCFHGEC